MLNKFFRQKIDERARMAFPDPFATSVELVPCYSPASIARFSHFVDQVSNLASRERVLPVENLTELRLLWLARWNDQLDSPFDITAALYMDAVRLIFQFLGTKIALKAARARFV